MTILLLVLLTTVLVISVVGCGDDGGQGVEMPPLPYTTTPTPTVSVNYIGKYIETPEASGKVRLVSHRVNPPSRPGYRYPSVVMEITNISNKRLQYSPLWGYTCESGSKYHYYCLRLIVEFKNEQGDIVDSYEKLIGYTDELWPGETRQYVCLIYKPDTRYYEIKIIRLGGYEPYRP